MISVSNGHDSTMTTTYTVFGTSNTLNIFVFMKHYPIRNLTIFTNFV